MMYIFNEITPDSALLANINSLYESAFPPDERRDFAIVRHLLDAAGAFRIHAALDSASGEFAAFVSFWDFGSFTYIEHLAVMPPMRGKGIGHRVMKHVFESVSARVVLEVEPPADDVTRKRIAFYESLGMSLWSDFPYIQPPYAPHLNPVELRLMTAGSFSLHDLTAAVATIHREVYGVVC